MSISSKDDVDEDINAFSSGLSERHLKLVLVGDGAVGKTCMLVTQVNGKFPTDYVPTVFDNYNLRVSYNKRTYSLGLWDTASQENHDRLRPLSFVNVDVFVLCFSLVDPNSLSRITSTWCCGKHGELVSYRFKPILLVGTKMDLRECPTTLKRLEEKGCRPVTTSEGRKVAKQIFAIDYLECSSLTKQGLDEVFQKCCHIGEALEEKNKMSTILSRTLFKRKKSGANDDIIERLKRLEKKEKEYDTKAKREREEKEKKKIDDLKKKAKRYERRFLREVEQSTRNFKNLYLNRLSEDVVRYLLSEFHLIRLQSMYQYSTDLDSFRKYFKKLGVKKSFVGFQFFGYFRDSIRKVIQLFFNFDQTGISYHRGIGCIPKRVKFLQNQKKILSFKEVFKNEQSIYSILNYPVNHFDDLVKVHKIDKLENLSLFSKWRHRPSGDFESQLEKCINLRSLTFTNEEKSITIFKQPQLKLFHLKEIVLINCTNFSFAFLQQLEAIKLRFYSRWNDTGGYELKMETFKEIVALSNLKVIKFVLVWFNNIGDSINELFSKESCKNIALSQTQFDTSCVKEISDGIEFLGVIASSRSPEMKLDIQFENLVRLKVNLDYYLAFRKKTISMEKSNSIYRERYEKYFT